MQPATPTLEQFAEIHNLRLRKESCGDYIILGRRIGSRLEDGCHIYDGYKDGRLGAYFQFTTIRKWNNARRTLLAAGLALRQNGDMEGCIAFNAADQGQVEVVLKLARVRPRRQPSPKQLEQLLKARLSLPKAVEKGHPAPKVGSNPPPSTLTPLSVSEVSE